MFTELFTIARTWKQHKCPSTEEWMKKLWYIYSMEYCSVIKKEWHWVICREVDGEGNGTPLQYSCLENPMDGGAWWAAVHGVLKSRTRLSDFTFTFMHWWRKWQPTPVFLPGESQGRGAWWAAVYGVAQSQIRLKRLSSSSKVLLYVTRLNLLIFCQVF